MTRDELLKIFSWAYDNWAQLPKTDGAKYGTNRNDLKAMILLDSLVPEKGNMISSATHDEIFFDVSLEELEKVANEDQIKELISYGIRIDDYEEGLAMFV